MTANRRTMRVASLIRAELSRLFIEELSDPRVREVTVTEVELSGDLKTARVYFDVPASLADAKDLKEVTRGLEHAAPFIRKKVAENVELRYVPDFRFVRDTQSQEISQLYKVMDDLRK